MTATRTAVPVDDTLVSTTLLTDEAIQARQVLSLQDLFMGESGVQMSNNGGLGKVSSVFLRGAEAGQVLVLVDGVRMGSSTIGTTAFQYLPINDIDHVEIVRGPLSSLYGSEAMGGVIQLFTRRPTADGVSVAAEASAGSHDTYSIGGNVGVVSGPVSYGISLSNLTSNGYPNCTGAPYVSPASPGGGCFTYDPLPDGYHNLSGSAHVGVQLSESADLDALVLRSEGGTRYAGSYTNHESFVEQAAALSGHWSPTDALRLTAQIGQSHDNEFDTLNFVEPPGNLFDTTRDSASLQMDWHAASGQILTVGGDALRDKIASDAQPPFAVLSRDVTGIFGEYQIGAGPHQLAVSVRNDHNSQFGDRTTGSVAWGYALARQVRLLASAGTAFHAPSFDELYYPGFGNPSLRPESSTEFELGLEQHLARGRWSLRAYQRNVRDLIGFDADNVAANTDKARIRGAELQGTATLARWSGTLNANWLDPRNRTPDSPEYGNLLNRRAKYTGMLEIARHWVRWRAAVRMNLEGPRFDDLANTEPLGGFSAFDLLLEWRPLKTWALQAKLGNALDHRYDTALYYPQDGRNFLLTLRYQPQPWPP